MKSPGQNRGILFEATGFAILASADYFCASLVLSR